jgi:hypothetical protein
MAVPARAIILLLLGSLLIGLAHIAMLPPFEGFDETGHYSYIRHLAETGTWPRYGTPIAREVDDYLAVAPAAEALTPRFTYRGFFAGAGADIEAARKFIHAAPEAPPPALPGRTDNWQAQHPPLYYLALSPAYLIAKTWSFGGRIAIMRGVSYGLAWGGLCLAVFFLWRAAAADQDDAGALPLAVAMWPLMFPMWFPEMGRLGNDSLVVLAAALMLPLIRRVMSPDAGVGTYALLGTVMGLGLLTKATVLPLAFAIGALLAIAAVMDRQNSGRLCRGLAVLALAALLICGWWYLQKFIETGSIIGSNDAVAMKNNGGLIAGLLKNWDTYSVARLPWVYATSFLWAGTWSFVQPPRIAMLLLVATATLIALASLRHITARKLDMAGWLPLMTLATFIAALVYQSLVLISIGIPSAPAWYLHSFAPILAPLLAYGAIGLTASRWRAVGAAVLLYPLAFLPFAIVVNALYFSGCATTWPGLQYVDLSSATACAGSDILRNLAVLAFPRVSLVLFCLGWIVSLVGMIMALRYLLGSQLAVQHGACAGARPVERRSPRS